MGDALGHAKDRVDYERELGYIDGWFDGKRQCMEMVSQRAAEAVRRGDLACAKALGNLLHDMALRLDMADKSGRVKLPKGEDA